MFLELIGILIFAKVSNRLFNVLKHINIKEVVAKNEADS